MREIKFRAWDKTFKRWEEDLCFAIGRISKNLDHERFGLCQFTGLKDRNGKEIYEGDIINFKHDDGVFVDERTAPVNWYQDCYGTGWGRLTQHEEIEVIGNIYENKELLTHE